MCHSILILWSNSQNDPNHYDTLMPLCIKNTLQKIIILDITPTVLDLLTWDLVPRWTITFYLDYLNDHYSPTHHDTFVTLFRKSPLVTLLPLAFEYNYVDILVRVCSIQLLKKNHKFAAFLRFYKRFFTLIHIKDRCKIYNCYYTIALMINSNWL